MDVLAGVVGERRPDGTYIVGVDADPHLREQLKHEESKRSGSCYVATCVYGSYDCPQVWTLRRFRDSNLASTWYGRAFIRIYYAISPVLVRWFGNMTWFKRFWKRKLDAIIDTLQKAGVESTLYRDREW